MNKQHFMTSCLVLQHFLYSPIKDSGNRIGGKMLEQSVHSRNKLGPFTMLLSELQNSTPERLQVRSSAAAARAEAEQIRAGQSRAKCPSSPAGSPRVRSAVRRQPAHPGRCSQRSLPRVKCDPGTASHGLRPHTGEGKCQ